jgi:hypothetical protein
MHDVAVPEVWARLKMPDEKDKIEDGWSMPEPVFRSSEGRTVKADVDVESDIPTEQANRDFSTESSISTGTQAIRPKANRHVRHLNKRKRSFWERNAAGLIVLAVFLLGALIYLAWLYRGKIL